MVEMGVVVVIKVEDSNMLHFHNTVIVVVIEEGVIMMKIKTTIKIQTTQEITTMIEEEMTSETGKI